MANAVEVAVNKYIQASRERDPVVRAKLIEECIAPDVRVVMRSREINGRAALAESIDRFLADPQMLGFRIASAIDASGQTYRFRSVVERRDGTELEFFDAGLIDANGRIVLQLTFSGPLGESAERFE